VNFHLERKPGNGSHAGKRVAKKETRIQLALKTEYEVWVKRKLRAKRKLEPTSSTQ